MHFINLHDQSFMPLSIKFIIGLKEKKKKKKRALRSIFHKTTLFLNTYVFLIQFLTTGEGRRKEYSISKKALPVSDFMATWKQMWNLWINILTYETNWRMIIVV